MAKLYDRSTPKQTGAQNPEHLCSTIQAFLASCRRPAALDFGDSPIALHPDRFLLEVRAGKASFDVWDDERSLSRRILSIDQESTGALDCSVQRFGGTTAKLSFLDLDRPQTASRYTRGKRQNFAELFRRMLSRQLPSWQIESLSSALDLTRSFSSIFPRAHLRLGNSHVAALACPVVEEERLLLASALLWFDSLRSRLGPQHNLNLCLFVPEQAGNITAQRLRWLHSAALKPRIFRFNEHGLAGEVDPDDLGNLDTHVRSGLSIGDYHVASQSLLSELTAIAGVGCCPEISGALSVRFRGLEFAKLDDQRILLGIETKIELPLDRSGKVVEFARHLSELGSSGELCRLPLPSYPERWFESSVRANLRLLDPGLLPAPLHGQVLTFAGGDRELIDLLAITPEGVLAVIELKTSEDIQFPLQGLDYWMRIKWHASRGELSHLFPGIRIAERAPKLMLVAPALNFHPSNQAVLRYFSPSVEVERIGVNSDWESSLKVILRLKGADAPVSHQRSHDIRRTASHQERDQEAQPQ